MDELEPLGDAVVGGDGDAADHVAVAVQVLRRRVIHDVGAERQRTLEVRRSERVVDDEQRTAPVGELGNGGDVGEAHHRVGRRLDEHQPRRGRHGVGNALRIARVDVREREPEVLEDFVEQAERAAVDVFTAHDVVAGAEQLHDRVQAPHAAGEGEAMPAPFERGYVSLQRLARGVLAASVLIPLVYAQAVLHIR